jgi:ParB family chromosome partitioning protein
MASKIDAAEDLERQLLAGQAIVEIDPDLVDDSFVDDRLKESREDIEDLVETFKERGQDTPILVRPHRDVDGRFETIFGHRRKRAAKATGRKVRAVVRQISDRDHVIAQGQENAARSGLSFIERATFASNMGERKFDNQTIMAALRINKTVLSKMQAVTTQIPLEVIQAIGPAAEIGRDRWYELAVKLRDLGSSDEAIALVRQPTFREIDGATRFNSLFRHLDSIPRPRASSSTEEALPSWEPKDQSVRVTTKGTKKAVTIALRRPDGVRFGHWISENLESLYNDFRRTERNTMTGD